jgi:hypothetical protein
VILDGEGIADMMKLVADDVRSLVIAGAGHWVVEEAPNQMLAALTTSWPRTGDRSATVHTPTPDTATTGQRLCSNTPYVPSLHSGRPAFSVSPGAVDGMSAHRRPRQNGPATGCRQVAEHLPGSMVIPMIP